MTEAEIKNLHDNYESLVKRIIELMTLQKFPFVGREEFIRIRIEDTGVRVEWPELEHSYYGCGDSYLTTQSYFIPYQMFKLSDAEVKAEIARQREEQRRELKKLNDAESRKRRKLREENDKKEYERLKRKFERAASKAPPPPKK